MGICDCKVVISKAVQENCRSHHCVRQRGLLQAAGAFQHRMGAYAAGKESYPKLFQKIAHHIMALDNLGVFIPQALSNLVLVWAYATAKEPYPLLFQKVADAAINKQHELNPQNIANLLLAYAANGHIDQHIFSSFAPSAKALLEKCNSQDLANIGWVYAVANVAAQCGRSFTIQ